MIDWVHFDHPVLSISISTNDEFIATSHQKQIGIQIWANNCFYSDVLLSTVPSTPCLMDVLTSTPDKVSPEVPSSFVASPEEGINVHLTSRVAGGTVVLTHAPRSKWPSLTILEQIRERNKPEEPPKAPEKAPFFLPTTSALQPEFVTSVSKESSVSEEKEMKTSVLEANMDSAMEEESPPKRFVTRGDVMKVENELQRLLRICANDSNQTEIA